MKTLELQQIEVSMKDGSVRLIIYRVIDGEPHSVPHIIGLMPEDDPEIIFEVVKNHLASMGYPWIEDKILARAMKHRELILADPEIAAANAAREK